MRTLSVLRKKMLCYEGIQNFDYCEHFAQKLGRNTYCVNQMVALSLSSSLIGLSMRLSSVKSIKADAIEKFFSHGKEYVHALGPVSFEILPGEFVCILGESGCGKSTLWRILAGLEVPTVGAVYMDKETISGPDHRRGIVFQNPALLPWLSVKDNIALGFKIRREKPPSDLIDKVIKLVGLEGFAKTKPGKLSGGMAQRAAIARALVSNPDVLLMDEPFASLDALTRLRMQEALLDIWEQHKITVVFITHDIDEAIALASRILVITPRPGKISKTFAVALSRPRLRSSLEFLELKGAISDELIRTFKNGKEANTKHLTYV